MYYHVLYGHPIVVIGVLNLNHAHKNHSFDTQSDILDSYISIITSEIMNAPEHISCGNLSFEERSALKDLRSKLSLVIREADKGCSVVVMDRQRHNEEGYRQLNDTSVYPRTRATAISDIEEDIQHLANQLHIEGVIADDIPQFAIRRNTKAARFYLLPKVHKKVYQADQLLQRAVLPQKESQK